MIVYADTSALVKLFVSEAGSERVRDLMSRAKIIGTGLLTRVELGAALARSVQRGLFSPSEALKARERVREIWPTWVHIIVDEAIVSRAEALAWTYTLRGYDAIHLACALAWQEHLGHPVILATFDRELWEVARQAKLSVWPAEGL